MATIRLPLKISEVRLGIGPSPVLAAAQGTKFPVPGLAFDAAVEEVCYFLLRARDYGSGDLTLKVSWYPKTASSGAVIFGAAVACITPNSDTQDVETKPFAVAQTVTDSHLGTTAKRLHEIDLPIINLDLIASGDLLIVRFYRDADAVGDTLIGDVCVVGLELSYSDT